MNVQQPIYTARVSDDVTLNLYVNDLREAIPGTFWETEKIYDPKDGVDYKGVFTIIYKEVSGVAILHRNVDCNTKEVYYAGITWVELRKDVKNA